MAGTIIVVNTLQGKLAEKQRSPGKTGASDKCFFSLGVIKIT